MGGGNAAEGAQEPHPTGTAETALKRLLRTAAFSERLLSAALVFCFFSSFSFLCVFGLWVFASYALVVEIMFERRASFFFLVGFMFLPGLDSGFDQRFFCQSSRKP